MELSIIIVTWNVEKLLDECLSSIWQSGIMTKVTPPTTEIIVVDSGSSDDTVKMVWQKYPQVRLLAQAENIGYTKANNIGLAAASGHYLMLLNPDTEIITDALQKMTSYLDDNAKVGVVGPHTLNSDGTTQSTRRRFPTRALAFFESTWLQPYTPKSLLNHYYVRDQDDQSVYDVDWVQGSAIMMRRDVYEQIGGLDEGYVMYSEELDWCHRAKDAGWRVAYLGTAQIIHHGGKSSEQAGAWKHIHFQKSKIRYFEKFHGKAFANMLRLFLKLSYRWQILLEGIKSIIGHKRDLRQERIATYREVLRSGL